MSKMSMSLLAVALPALLAAAPAAFAYDGSSFNQVWSKVTSDPYEKPHNAVTAASMFDYGRSLILEAANRTISDRDDILPRFTKLVHPNGICLKGTWTIDEDSPYSGYFKKGSQGLVIARLSAAFTPTEKGDLRAMGFTTKLFPSLDPNAVVKTANFFTIDDFAGTYAPHFLDTALTNAPALTPRPELGKIADVAIAVAGAFAVADLFPNIRQMYQVSELGLPAGQGAVTPKFTRISTTPGQPRIDAADFRDELNSKLYPGQTLHFDIGVTSQGELNVPGEFKKVGHMDLTDSVISDSCDHALHFNHPKWRTDLNYGPDASF